MFSYRLTGHLERIEFQHLGQIERCLSIRLLYARNSLDNNFKIERRDVKYR